MELLEKLLHDIGLSEIESQIFINCQKYGRLSVGGMTRFINFPRSTLYGYVEKMAANKFLIAENGKAGNYYRAITPDELIALIKDKKSQFDEVIKKVETMKPAIVELASQNKYIPKVQYYEGEGTIALIDEKINNAKERYFISDMDTIMDVMQRTPLQAAKAFIHKSGYSLEILLDSPRAREYAKLKKKLAKKWSYTFTIKFLPTDKQYLQSDNILIDGSYFHIAYGDQLIGIEINNPIFYQTQKILFEQLWKSLK